MHLGYCSHEQNINKKRGDQLLCGATRWGGWVTARLGALAPRSDLAVHICPRSTNSKSHRLLSVPSK